MKEPAEMSPQGQVKKKFLFPHIYVLLMMIIIACAIATWLLPAGEFERVKNAAGRTIVVAGTYHPIPATPVGPFQMIQAIYGGMLDAANIIFFIMIAYASIGLIIATGAFNGLVSGLLRIFKGKSRTVIIPVFIAILGVASSTIGVFEEAFPFVPIFVGIAIAMGYDAIVGLAIVACGVGIGYSGAVMNPFTVGMAQSIAELPPMSGAGFRIFCHISMVVVASIYTMRYALKIQEDPTKSLLYGSEMAAHVKADENLENYRFGIREILVLATLAVGIVVVVYGTKAYGWYLQELCAIFLIMGLASAAIMGWSPSETAEKVAASFADMAMAAMMVGLARAILVVLRAGSVIDTVVYGLAFPLSYMPSWIAAECMLVVQTLLNFLVPSGSGQAVISMPIMAPLSDLLGIPRQIAVLCFQFGDGLSNIVWPTAFAPVLCALAGIKLDRWWKWMVPLFILLILTQMILIAIAMFIGWA
ncbi:YfcC family protein [Cloacibacillus evryensis]|uniref:YfcC family protein n=2 Tax=Cloacibacillus evryensis TaxID=508460 RepID=UPI000240DEC8|nr:TIGR00366 family protein [Cloacibacillus evryensis]EHL69301.1 hypothetical protein HMPREF1006_02028 [Synergistes sp. 3_1_syn1]